MLNNIDILLIQLLNNVTHIQQRLIEIEMKKLQNYIDCLSHKQEEIQMLLDQNIEDQIDIISDLVVLISRIYRIVPSHLRAYIFQDYEFALNSELSKVYTLKAEIRYFYTYMEPLIHEYHGIGIDAQEG